MIRLILFLIILGAAATLLSYLADRPGAIVIDWLGYRVETTAFVAAVAVAALVVVSVGAWQLFRFIVQGPDAVRAYLGIRRREKGLRAIARGLVAVGAGDTRTAQRAADDARAYLGRDPMTLLLASQAAQLAGDRREAVGAFQLMLENPETRALGLRGLYVEAVRAGDAQAARRHAEAAVLARPGIPWAANALLAFQAGAREWDAALRTIRSNADNRLIDRDKAKRLKAVVLTAQAIEAEATDRARARALALEAHNLAPDLVPAAEIAARLSSEMGDIKRATRVIEMTWKLFPHPDLADAYTHARMGDAARDRFKRARALADLKPDHPESRMIVAAAAMEARDFHEARAALAPLLDAPTRRAALLMAALAEAEDRPGEAREWLARSSRAKPDPVWMADGFVSDRWLPVSPATARLDAFEWRAPVEAAPGAALPEIPMPVIPDPIEATPTQLPPPAEEAVLEPVPLAASAAEPPPPAEPENAPPRRIIPDDPGPDPNPPEDERKRFGIF